jgi:hypothetical protein
MHQLERETYDDAFLNEAMEGYEELAGDDHEETLADLKTQLHKRAAKEKKDQLIMWRLLPIAAIVLVLLGMAYWFFKPYPIETQITQATKKESKKQIVLNKPAPQNITHKERKLLADASIEPKSVKKPETVSNNLVIIGYPPTVKYKTDTVEYRASDYKVRANSSVNEILKKAEGFEIDTNGSVTFNGQSVTKARLNGKDYMGGDVAKAVQSLPADIIEKFQVVDDYGYQAGRTGIKSGDATKVLNLTTSMDKNKSSAGGYFLNEPLLYTPQVIFKTDTIEYITNNYPIPNKAKIIDILRNLPAFEIDNGKITSQGKYIRKIIIGKQEYMGEKLLDAVNKLPADVLEKVQLIDDYRNMANRPSYNTGPEKILNLVVREMKNRRLPWAIELQGVIVPGDTVAKPKPLMGWKKYADYIRRNGVTSAKSSYEVMLFFYVAPDGKISNVQAIGYRDKAVADKVTTIINKIKDGPAWLGYAEPRQIWLRVKLPKK